MRQFRDGLFAGGAAVDAPNRELDLIGMLAQYAALTEGFEPGAGGAERVSPQVAAALEPRPQKGGGFPPIGGQRQGGGQPTQGGALEQAFAAAGGDGVGPGSSAAQRGVTANGLRADRDVVSQAARGRGLFASQKGIPLAALQGRV
jgi:hypothetical protein